MKLNCTEACAALPLRFVLCVVPGILKVSRWYWGLLGGEMGSGLRYWSGCGVTWARLETLPGVWSSWGLSRPVSGNKVHFQFLPFSFYPSQSLKTKLLC